MSHKSGLKATLGVAVVLLSMLAGGLISACTGDDSSPSSSATATATTTAEGATHNTRETTGTGASTADSRTQAFTAIANLPDLVEQVEPSVVRIETIGPQGPGAGTGMVVDDDGHVLTNYHVIEGATSVTVYLQDGTAGVGEVLGTDPGSDLAVIATDIPQDRLHPVTFGDSSSMRVGESVFAIGNPFRQNFSVTSGIISAVERVTQSSFTERPIRGVLQTDAALNPGNSGGPLFNVAGEVIGVNTSIENPSGRFFAGIGFAVPSNTAKRFLPRLIAGERIQHPQLGIQGEPVNAVTAQRFGLNVDHGVYVIDVRDDSSAAQAGLRPAGVSRTGEAGPGGDVIVAIDGEEIEGFEDLARAIDEHDVGDEITLTVNRNGDEIDLTATLQAWTG